MFINEIVQSDMKDLTSRKEIPKDKLKGKKILVTGANGMLATYLIYFFMYLNETENADIDIYALTRNRSKAIKRFSSFEEQKRFHLLIGDVCDDINVDVSVDYIIHAAGNASPYFIVHDPVGIIRANTLGTMNVLNFAKNCERIRVLYTSTREVYGEMPFTVQEIFEDQCGSLDPTLPRSCYPESKRMAETLLESYRSQYNIDYVTVRIAHSYGPEMNIDNDGRVMADFISDVVHNRNIVLKSTGEIERAFCYITDAISGILIALLKGKCGETYNLANETEPMTIRDVAEQLVDVFPEKNIKVVFQVPKEMSLGYSRIGRIKLNTDKLAALGWKCRICLEQGLRKTVLSYEVS